MNASPESRAVEGPVSVAMISPDGWKQIARVVFAETDLSGEDKLSFRSPEGEAVRVIVLSKEDTPAALRVDIIPTNGGVSSRRELLGASWYYTYPPMREVGFGNDEGKRLLITPRGVEFIPSE